MSGLTSNPKIFQKAITNSNSYDVDIERGIKKGKSIKEIYESLIFEDIRNACDIFCPVYEKSGGRDGYVSIEVSPHLARDAQGTIEEAWQYARTIERENLLVKIPGTAEGFPAVERVIAQGINVNITLLFSVKSYEHAAWAYIRGLEDRVAKGQPLEGINSVASFFLSRIDTKVDARLDDRISTIDPQNQSQQKHLQEIKGKVAIANAKIAYQKHLEIINSDRWKALAEKGANVQRLLWASTSTKNPQYSDVMYVNELIAPNTVNTMPPDTIKACADHCNPVPNRIETGVNEAYHLLESLKEPDINMDLDEVMKELLQEGLEKFVQPYDSLMQSLQEKVKQLFPV